MCYDYLRERVAAGRDFPPSIWLAIRAPDVDAAEVFQRHLEHEDEAQRYYLACSIKAHGSAALQQALQARAGVESSDRIRRLLTDA